MARSYRYGIYQEEHALPSYVNARETVGSTTFRSKHARA